MPPAMKGSVGASVTTANNVATPTTLTPTLPAHATGDLLLCFTTCRSGTPTVATPSGWTSLINVVGTNGRLVLFGKIATSASETAPGCVWSGLTTGTSGTPAQAQCAVFTGTQLVTDVVGTVENGAASATVSASGTAITTLTDNDLVLALSTRLDDVGTWSAPATFTEIGEAASTSGADMASAWAYLVKTPTGSVAPADFAIASGVSFASSGVLIALKGIVATTYFGSVALATTFNSVISGSREAFGQVALPSTFFANVQGQRTTFGQVVSPFVFGKEVSGQRKTFGQIVFPINAAISTAGFRVGNTFFGALSLPITFSKDVRGSRKTFSQIISPFTFGKVVAGQRKTFGQVIFPINVGIFTAGYRPGLTLYGTLSFPITFGKDVRGVRRVFGQIALPIVFGKDLKGTRKTFGQIARPITFSKDVRGQKKTFGQIARPIVFSSTTQGRRRSFGQVSLPINLFIDVRTGRVRALGKIVFPIIIRFDTRGKVLTVGTILNDAENLYLGSQPVQAVYIEGQKVWPQ